MKFKLTEKYRPASRLRHAQKILCRHLKSFENKDINLLNEVQLIFESMT